MYAAHYGHLNCVSILLKHGLDLNAQNFYEQTALHRAAWAGHTKIMRMLIKAGADVNIRDDEHKTAFDIFKEDRPDKYHKWMADNALRRLKKEDRRGSNATGFEFDI